MKRFIIVFAGILFSISPILAQDLGTLFGTVETEEGARITNADILIQLMTPDRDPCGGGGHGGGCGDGDDNGGGNGDDDKGEGDGEGGGCGGGGCGEGDHGGCDGGCCDDCDGDCDGGCCDDCDGNGCGGGGCGDGDRGGCDGGCCDDCDGDCDGGCCDDCEGNGCGGGGCGDGDRGGCGDNDCDGGCGNCKCESDENGRFEIDGLQPGNYRVTVSAEGYLATETEIEVEAERETGVEIILIADESALNAGENTILNPNSTDLLIAYPNPFNPAAEVSLNLNQSSFISLSLFDMSGREIQALFSGELNAGRHSFTVDGSDLSAGTYLVRLTTPNEIISKPITLAK